MRESTIRRRKGGKAGELEGDRDREHSGAGTLRVISRDWENRCGRRRSNTREMEEGVDDDLGQIAGCSSRSGRVAALSVGGGRPERPLREKGKRRESQGGNTEERRKAVRGEGGVSRKDKCAAWSQDEVGPRTGPRGGCARPRAR